MRGIRSKSVRTIQKSTEQHVRFRCLMKSSHFPFTSPNNKLRAGFVLNLLKCSETRPHVLRFAPAVSAANWQKTARDMIKIPGGAD